MWLRIFTLVLLLGLVCGTPINEYRIYGGKPAKIEENPWLVSIQTSKGFHICGGSIISKYYILTAAHCVVDTIPLDDIRIRVGSPNNTAGGVLHRAYNAIAHENFFYRMAPIEDIALILLQEPITYTKTAQPIPLFNQGETAVGQATITGWGQQGVYDTKKVEIAHTITIPIIDKMSCDRSLRQTAIGALPAGQICAGSQYNGNNVCPGDSGSPLFIKGRQAGIVSWGPPICGEPKKPRIFTEVASYRAWIRAWTNV